MNGHEIKYFIFIFFTSYNMSYFEICNSSDVFSKYDMNKWNEWQQCYKVWAGRIKQHPILSSACFISLYFTLWYFTVQYSINSFCFYKLKVCGSHALAKVPTDFLLCVSASHLDNYHKISSFSLLLYFLWWFVIYHPKCCYCNCLGLWQTNPIEYGEPI